MVKPNSSSLMAEKGETSNENKEVKYKGVRKRKWGKWVSEIRLPNSRERIWLGSHNTAEKAARAFDAALFCLRGRNAKFNFPETPPPDSILGGGGRSLTSTEIQVVAAHYANSGRQEVVSTSAGGQVMEGTSSTSTSNGMASMEAIDRSLFEMVEPSHDNTVLDYSFISGLNDLHDDMYMQSHLGPTIEDNEEENDQEDGDYSHKSNFLWNF